MATEAKKAKKQMKEISICADCWLGVFHWVSPFELGQKIAPLSDRFDRLVDEHFRTRKWALGFLEIFRQPEGRRVTIAKNLANGQRSFRRLPQAPLLDNIVGFESIRISYINPAVVEFLHRIQRLFQPTAGGGTNLYILAAADDTDQMPQRRKRHAANSCCAVIRHHIWPLLRDNVRALFLSAYVLDYLRRELSPAVLTDCASLRTIDSLELFPIFPVGDSALCGQAMAEWLITPRADGLPKVLNCGFSHKKLNALKAAFLSASSPANFILFLLCSSSSDILPFELANHLTGERLAMRQIANNGNANQCLLVRCPMARDETKWAEWEEEAIKWEWTDQWNCIVLGFTGTGDIDQNLLST